MTIGSMIGCWLAYVAIAGALVAGVAGFAWYFVVGIDDLFDENYLKGFLKIGCSVVLAGTFLFILNL